MAGEGTEIGTAYLAIVPETSQIAPRLAQAMQGAGQSAGEVGGRSMGGGITDAIGSLGGKAGPIAAVLGVAGLAAGAVFVKSLTAGMEREKQADLIQARLGIDEASMKSIGSAAARAYTSNFGASIADNMETARNAIQSGLLSTDDTTQQTEAVISQITTIAELMGEETTAVSKAAGQAIKTGIAGSAVEAFDLFAAAERNGLNGSEDFLDTINEYGTQFRKLGLTGPEAVGLINQAVKGGARDADIAADAWKEFSIRVVDGSESTSEAFDELGFSSEDMIAKFAAGGATAREATGELLAKIREIEDPVEKNKLALALFGTQAEDLGGALNSFNLDTAVASLGEFQGAAQNAADTMGGNTAGTIESARRSIEVSMEGVQNSLAQAFGPTLEKVATWVQTHQPEITGFFIKIGEAAFTLGDVMLLWASTTASNLSVVLRSFGNTLEGILNPIGTAAVAIGELTGKQGLVDFGNSLKSAQDKLNGAADGLDGFANIIDNKGRPALANMRDAFVQTADEAKNAQLVTRALGAEVEAVPNGKNIIISSNTPEQTTALESLGLSITKLPDGRFEVSAGTADAQKTLDGFIVQNGGKKITIEAEVALSTRIQNGDLTVSKASPWATKQADGGILSFADGKLPDDALIQKGRGSGLVQWAEGETQEEAFIPLAKSKRARSIGIWREVGRRFGFDMESMANGGILSWARGEAGKAYQFGGTGNPGWDCSAIAGGLWAKATGKMPNARYFTTDSDFGSMGWQRGIGGENDLSIGTNGGSGTAGHMASTVDGVNVEASSGDGVEVGAGALGANDFAQQWHWPLGGNPADGGGGTGLGGSGGGSGGSGGSLGAGGSTNSSGATEVFVVNMPGSGSNAITAGTGTDTAAIGTDTTTATPTTDTPSTTPTTTEQADHPLQGMPLTGELFNGSAPWYMASSPEQALANLSTQASAQWTETSEGFQSFFQDNWKEMLETGAGVLGMGAMSGGTTLNVTNNGMDPNSAAAAVERVVRRRTMATRSSGGFGR
ncbi:phage tail tape measure protein [Nocardia sp. NPDC058519]|uniref:phage tail tape measure protein n=1 Tax=Nocardia sp. NPDC058519 TaxID=3346535 RepID=UPI0036531EA5